MSAIMGVIPIQPFLMVSCHSLLLVVGISSVVHGCEKVLFCNIRFNSTIADTCLVVV